MLYLNDIPLPQAASDLLSVYQAKVDTKPTFAEQAAAGKKLFSSYNKSDNAAFKEVRKNLAEMSGGTIRCNYCEDSHANQVEHIYPKDFYPNKCFKWTNYCYACGPCNQPKSNKFSIHKDSDGTELDLKKQHPKDTVPPPGKALLIDPRTENPVDFLFLDIQNTFKFAPFSDDTKAIRRAEYSIEILGLNSRSYLVKARRVAFSGFKARLFYFVNRKNSGASANELSEIIQNLKAEHHQTVWFEMKRQRSVFPDINNLFLNCPEALTW